MYSNRLHLVVCGGGVGVWGGFYATTIEWADATSVELQAVKCTVECNLPGTVLHKFRHCDLSNTA